MPISKRSTLTQRLKPIVPVKVYAVPSDESKVPTAPTETTIIDTKKIRTQSRNSKIKKSVSDPLSSEAAAPASDEDLYTQLVRWKARDLTRLDPQTIDELATALGVSADKLVELARKPSFPDDCVAESIAWGKTQIPTMMRLAHKSAIASGSAVEAQRFVEMVASISIDKDKMMSNNNTQINIFANVDDEKFARIAQRFIAAAPAEAARALSADPTELPHVRTSQQKLAEDEDQGSISDWP